MSVTLPRQPYEPDIPEWGANLHRMPKKHLQGLLKRYVSQLAAKQDVMQKHNSGTSYHTRASREAQMYSERIEKILSVLAKK